MNRRERRARARRQSRAIAAEARLGGPEADLRLGDALVAAGRFAEAVAPFRRAVAARAGDPVTLGKLAYCLASSGEVGEAIDCYHRALALAPDNPGLITNLGVLLNLAGRPAEARAAFERALALAPNHANALFHLAETLAKAGRGDEARGYFARAAALYDRLAATGDAGADDLVKLAVALMALDRAAAAVRWLERALALRPDHALALARLGFALAKLGRFREAMHCYRRAAALDPRDAEARRALGLLLLELSEYGPAARALKRALRARPDDPIALYFHAALAGEEAPEAPPEGYVEGLFDGYAETFDAHLVAILDYHAPELLRTAVGETTGVEQAAWTVLDLGCGTGLCGSQFRGLAGRLIGVDKSARMLAKARERGLYDELRQDDLVAALRAERGTIDLAVATDVFIYVGALEAVFAAARAALRDPGWLAFTTEDAPGAGFALTPGGRYAYSPRYIHDLAAAHGFTVASEEAIALRKESGAPLAGRVYVLATR